MALTVLAMVVTPPPPVSASGQTPNKSDAEPWVVVDRPKPSRYDLLWNPCILVGSDGTLTASVEHRGHYSTQIGTYVYRSTDRGATWKKVAHLDSPRQASLFEAGGNLHLIGIDGSGRGNSGHPILRTSTDCGATWSSPEFGSPGWLLGDPFRQLDSGPVAAVTAAGRVWRPFVREKQALVVASALVDSDLSDDASWTWSSELPLEKSWAWDGSALLPRDSASPPLLLARKRLESPILTATLSSDGRSLARREESPKIALPERAAGYSLPRDADGRVVVLTKSETIEREWGSREIALTSSKDLVTWDPTSILFRDLREKDRAVGFGWAGWAVQGEDLVALICARMPELGSAARSPSRRWTLLFVRLPSFRARTPADSPLWDGR